LREELGRLSERLVLEMKELYVLSHILTQSVLVRGKDFVDLVKRTSLIEGAHFAFGIAVLVRVHLELRPVPKSGLHLPVLLALSSFCLQSV
jgi:hypothetical protein